MDAMDESDEDYELDEEEDDEVECSDDDEPHVPVVPTIKRAKKKANQGVIQDDTIDTTTPTITVEAVAAATPAKGKKRKIVVKKTATPPPQIADKAAIAVKRSKKKFEGTKCTINAKTASTTAVHDPDSNIPEIKLDTSLVRDFSSTGAKLPTEKFLLGDRFSLQVGQVLFPRGRGYSFEALVFTRAPTDNELQSGKKPFRFNLPAKLIVPLYGVINAIVEQAGLKPKSAT